MSKVKQAKQFETIEQINRTLAEIDAALADLTGSFDRLGRLRVRLAKDYAELQAQADDLDWQTEEEFAASMIGVKPAMLARLRRDHSLPHCRVGVSIRYTREQRRRVAEILEVSNSKQGESRLISRAA